VSGLKKLARKPLQEVGGELGYGTPRRHYMDQAKTGTAYSRDHGGKLSNPPKRSQNRTRCSLIE
jgi:hypothetical protein